MNICLVNPTGLIRRPISELANRLNDRGHTVGILTPAAESGRHHESYLDDITIHTYAYREAPGSYEWPIPNGFTDVLEEVEDDYDVFHSWTHFYLSSYLLAWHQPDNHVVTLDTVPGESFTMGTMVNAAFKAYNRTLGRWVLSRADAVTVYSDALKPFLAQTGYKADAYATPTGVIEPDVAHDPDLPDDYVAFVGLVTKRKGIDRVLEVAENIDAEVLVAGERPAKPKWEERAPPNVSFLGQIDYVPALMDQARCLFLPSRGEGLPGVVMEAMAMRCPVVASDIPCIPDLIPSDDHGFLVDQDNIDGFVDAIEQCSDKEVRQRVTMNAYKRIRSKFSWTAATQRFLDVYDDVIEA